MSYLRHLLSSTQYVCVYVVAETCSFGDFQVLDVTHEVFQQSAPMTVSCLLKAITGSYQQPVTVSDNLLLNNKKLVMVKTSSRNLHVSHDWYWAKTVTSVIVHQDARCLPKET